MNTKHTIVSLAVTVGLLTVPAPIHAQSESSLQSMLDQARTQLMGMLDTLNGDDGQEANTNTTAANTDNAAAQDTQENESNDDKSVVTTDLLDQELDDIRTLIQKQADATTGSDENTTYDAGNGLSLSSDNAFSVNSGAGSYWNQTGNDLYYNGGKIGVGTSSPVSEFSVSGNVSASSYSLDGNSFIRTSGNSMSIGKNTIDPSLSWGGYTFIGEGAGGSATGASGNTTAIGQNAMGNTKNPNYYNTAVGANSLANNNGGYDNTAVGGAAGNSLVGGQKNTAIGRAALSNVISGKENTAVGAAALKNATGSSQSNIALGKDAGISLKTGNNNVYIGTGVGSASSESNRLYIENGGGSNPLIYGEFDNNNLSFQGKTKITDGGTSTPSYQLDVEISSDGDVAGFTDTNGTCTIDPTSTSLSCSSDRRLKDDITKLSTSSVLNNISKLSAVTYRWDGQDDGSKQYGFVAQDVEDVYPEFVSEGPDGYKQLSYSSFIPVALEGIKQLDIRLDEIEGATTTIKQLTHNESFVQKVATTMADLFAKGKKQFQTLVASERVKTPELCVGSTCLTEAQLKKVLAKTNTASNSFRTYEDVNSTQTREETGQTDQETDDSASSSTPQTASSTPNGAEMASSTPNQTSASSTAATSTDAADVEENVSTSTNDTDTGTSTQETTDSTTDQSATSTPASEDTKDETEEADTATSTSSS